MNEGNMLYTWGNSPTVPQVFLTIPQIKKKNSQNKSEKEKEYRERKHRYSNYSPAVLHARNKAMDRVYENMLAQGKNPSRDPERWEAYVTQWGREGLEAVQRAGERVQIKSKAEARANKNSSAPKYNYTAQLQDALYKIGAFEGIKDRTGKAVSYEKAVDGITGRMTRAAIKNAKDRGYIVNEGTGEVYKPEINYDAANNSDSSFLSDMRSTVSPITRQLTQWGILPNNYIPTNSPNTGMQAGIDHDLANQVHARKGYADKQGRTFYITHDGRIVAQYPMMPGRRVGDGSWAEKIGPNYSRVPNESAAGIFIANMSPTSKYYGNEPIIRLEDPSRPYSTGMIQAVHSPVSTRNAAQFARGEWSRGEGSSGCFRMAPGVMREIYNRGLLQSGDTIFGLPEVPGNELREIDGRMQMIWGGNNPETYVDAEGTRRKYHYNTTMGYRGDDPQ